MSVRLTLMSEKVIPMNFLLLAITPLNIETLFDNDYGYHLSGGVRSMASNTLELNAALSYYHLDIDISKSLTFGVVIHFSDSIALLAKYAISIDRDRDFDLLFGFRFSL
jgi:hypothetical protein